MGCPSSFIFLFHELLGLEVEGRVFHRQSVCYNRFGNSLFNKDSWFNFWLSFIICCFLSPFWQMFFILMDRPFVSVGRLFYNLDYSLTLLYRFISFWCWLESKRYVVVVSLLLQIFPRWSIIVFGIVDPYLDCSFNVPNIWKSLPKGVF